MRRALFHAAGLALCAAAFGIGGACAEGETSPGTGASGQGGGSGGEAGSGGSGPCGIDCEAIVTGPCTHAVCNPMTLLCEVVLDTDGTPCDDGEFCSAGDSCVAGDCTPGPPN